MRFSKYLLPTLKEAPSEAEAISHQLMLRAGMIRKVAAGIYSFLPLGLRVVKKVEAIIREEMDKAGALEVLLPVVNPAELWKESGRWDLYGKELLRLKDRHGREFCLGPTHEEIITDLVRKEVRSYRQLPLNLYQIQTKFRDEMRPRFGLMRGREFSMKDAYSFDRDELAAERSYMSMFNAYCNIFRRCGLRFKAVEAETGLIGGSFSHEFMVLAETGEEYIASCNCCEYSANIERARIGRRDVQSSDPRIQSSREKVYTPEKKTVAEVTEFLGIAPEALIKTLIYEADGRPVAALVRGDHEINELKLKKILGCNELNLAGQEVIEEVTGAPLGFSGPVGLNIKTIVDFSILENHPYVTGANEKDHHYVNVVIGRDFQPSLREDIRKAVEGDPCPCCEGRLGITKGIEVGHVFKLGTKYSEALKAVYLDEEGKERLIIMGCYGIGIGRTVAAAIEQNHDKDGIIFPLSIAPFQVEVLPVNTEDQEGMNLAEKIYDILSEKRIEVLLDDRAENPGVKFKDADLIGIPFRITIGPRNLKEGKVEIKERKTGRIDVVAKDEVIEEIEGRIRKEMERYV